MSVCHLAPIWNPYVLEEEETVIPASDWVQRWQVQVASAPGTPQIPPAACNITTPLSLSGWALLLKSYPYQDMVHFVLNGISERFRVGFTYRDSVLVLAKQNLQRAISHPEVVEDYFQTELDLSRLVGPFHPSLVPNVHINRFGVIPKNHQQST